MNHRFTKTVFAAIIIILALLQGPFIYYYCDGMFGFMAIIPWVFTGLALTLCLWYSYRKYPQTNNRFQVAALYIGVILGTISLFDDKSTVKWLDWHLRFAERERVVQQFIKDKTPGSADESGDMYTLNEDYYPPLSVGGNQVLIFAGPHHTIAVEFFTDRGLLDHYRAYRFTNNPEETRHADSLIKTGNQHIKRLAPQWYEVWH